MQTTKTQPEIRLQHPKKYFEQKVLSPEGTDCPETENWCNFAEICLRIFYMGAHLVKWGSKEIPWRLAEIIVKRPENATITFSFSKNSSQKLVAEELN